MRLFLQVNMLSPVTLTLLVGFALAATAPRVAHGQSCPLPPGCKTFTKSSIECAQDVSGAPGASNCKQAPGGFVCDFNPAACAAPPVTVDAREDRFSARGTATFDLLGNDAGSNLRIVRSSRGNKGGRTSIVTGGVRYTPPRNYTGIEVFEYTVAGDGGEDSALVFVDVRNAGTPPAPAAPPPPPTVSSDSVGKIASDLPVARSLENLCDLLTFQEQSENVSLTAGAQDLRATACSIVNESDSAAQSSAVGQVSGGQHQHGPTMVRFSRAQIGRIRQRLGDLRAQFSGPVSGVVANAESTSDSSLSGFDNGYGENKTAGNLPFRFSKAFGGGAGDDDSSSSGRWGVFVSGSVASGDGTESDAQFGFDYENLELTAGVDYLVPRDKGALVVGGALDVKHSEADSDGGLGGVETEGVGASLFGSWFGSGGWFLDGIVGYSSYDFSTSRLLDFTANGRAVAQRAEGESDGDQAYVGLGGGRELSLGKGFAATGSVSVRYSEGTVEGLVEQTGDTQAGFSMAMETSDIDIESLRSEVDLQINKAISTGFGVLLPYLGVTWVHEYENRGEDIVVRFVTDPFSEGVEQTSLDIPGASGRPTVFVVPGDENDADYFRVNIGSSAQFAGGKAVWVAFTAIAGLDDIDGYVVNAGFRMELP